MNQKIKYLIKNIGLLTISNFSSKILSFLLVPLYTSVLSTRDYGLYDLIATTVQLLIPLLTLDVVDAVMWYCLDKKYKENEVLGIGLVYILRSIFIFAVGLFVVGWLNLIPGIAGLEVFILAFFASNALNQLMIQFAKGKDSVFVMAVSGVIGTILTLFGNIFFLVIAKTGIKGFFLAYIISQLIQAIYIAIALKIWIFFPVEITPVTKKDMLRYSIPLIFAQLGWWVNNMSDRYIITFLCGIAVNGVFSAAYKIPTIINTLHSIFISAWQISAVKENKSSQASLFYIKVFVGLNIIMNIAGSVIIAFSKILARILYANDFYAAWQYVPFLTISSIINVSSGFVGAILSAKKNTKHMAFSTVIGAIVNIIMNIGLIFLIGAQGAAVATAISGYVILLLRLIVTKVDVDLSIPMKYVNFMLIVMTIQSICFIYMENYILSQIMCSIIILVVCKYMFQRFVYTRKTKQEEKI